MAKEITKEITVVFKTLLTQEEYEHILSMFPNSVGNLQTDYYFDTKRFTLKASDAKLRVKERESLTLLLERKKGYNAQRLDEPLTAEQFEEFKSTGKIPVEKIKLEIIDIIKEQNLINFLTLSTYRINLNLKKERKGRISLDKCTYVNKTDYELEYEVNNRELGKIDFINIIKEFNVTYKKSQSKLNRAYDALKKVL